MQLNFYLLLFYITILVSGFKCRVANEPVSVQYWSISDSKANDAFVREYKPQSPLIKLGGKNFNIKEAWVEYPHYQRNFHDEIEKQICSFVMTFESTGKKYKDFDLHSYIQGIINGNQRVWFLLSDNNRNSGTISLYYEDCPNSLKLNRVFLFFKK